MKKKLLYLLGALVLIGTLVWAFSPRPLEVETDILTRGRFERSVEDDGWTRLRDRYIVSAPLSGELSRLSLREGDVVEQGDVIALLSPVSPSLLDEREVQIQRERIRVLQAQSLAAETVVDRARIAMMQAQTDARRDEALHERHFISSAQRDTTQLALDLRDQELRSAQHQAQAARHALAEAQALLSESARAARKTRTVWPVRSPARGSVLRLPQQSEVVIPIGTPILEIGDTRRLEAVVDLLTEDAAQVREGMRAQLLNWGGGALDASVRRIEPSAVTKVSALGVEEQRVNVVLDILSPAEQWPTMGDGFRVGVRIPVQVAEEALSAPIGAIFPFGARHALFMVRAGHAELKEVDMIARNASRAWLREGPDSGTEVILYPPPSLKNGDRVTRLER
mgnify:CR=1 FL=1